MPSPLFLPRVRRSMNEQVDAVTALRLTLRANGYSPIPVLGKRALLFEWQKKSDAGEAEIANWPVVARGMDNTGALTKYMPCADVDITLPRAADAVEDVIRDWFDGRGTLLCRFGNAPKRALLFRTSVPFTKTAAHFKAPDGSLQKVEILGDGQQVVIDGIHPDTRQPYRWASYSIGLPRRGAHSAIGLGGITHQPYSSPSQRQRKPGSERLCSKRRSDSCSPIVGSGSRTAGAPAGQLPAL